MRQRFKEDSAGTIRFRPPEGPPITSATIVLYDRGGGELQAAAAATLPLVDTTVASTAISEGDDEFTVAAGTNIEVGKWLWLGTYGSDPIEMVRVKRIASTTVTTAEPIRYAHAIGQEVKGSEITYSLTATHTATLGRSHRALWGYIVGTTAYESTQLWDVVKTVFKLPLTPQDLTIRLPQDLRESGTEVFNMLDLIDLAETIISRDVARRGRRMDLVRDPEQFDEVGILCIRMILLERAMNSDAAYIPMYNQAHSLYQEELAQLLASGIIWYDENEDLSIDGVENSTESEEHVQAVYYLPIG